MDDTVVFTRPVATVEEVQQGWHELKLRIGQLEAERAALEQDNKLLRSLLERVIEHRQKSHGELVLLLSSLVSKLPINDVGVIVSRLVEHNAHVGEVCALLAKGKADSTLPQPMVLRALDQTKRDLASAVKPAVEELIKLDPPLEKEMLEALIKDPESSFSAKVVRAARCFVKGQLPKDRIVRDFGEPALVFFNDMTTDARRNPRPKPEEIVLAFKNEFEELLKQDSTLTPEKRQELQALYQRVQRSKGHTETARAQRIAFAKLSFILELLHYYGNQNTEAPEGIFAQRLPALIEQLVIAGPQENLDEKLIVQAEALLAHVISPDHRLMVVNNIGKAGGLAKTLKFVLRLRLEKNAGQYQALLNEIIPEFVRHLIPTEILPPAQSLIAVLRLIPAGIQRLVALTIKAFDRLRKPATEALVQTLGTELGLTGLEETVKAPVALPVEMEREIAWDEIKELITRRREPAAIATAIRNRLHARYDPDELKQSWITLCEADVMTFIRTFCQLPYLADGSTDSVARAVMESYVNRLTHEKYAATYKKVVNSLKNMFHANAHSPTLVNFMSLVKWVDADAAKKLSADIGMPATA
jgi:hypothetical protein